LIRTFRSSDTAALFQDQLPRRFHAIERVARRKLLFLNSVKKLEDLKVPPGNQLERLRGDREGSYSIRINDQWRICFAWHDGDAWDVEIVDYH